MFSRHDILYSDTTNFTTHNFKPLKSIGYAFAHLIFTASMGITILTTMAYYNHETYMTQNYLICQAVFWLFSFVLYLKYVSKHHNLKLGGHFVFYKKMEKVALMLFIIPSFFSSLMLSFIGVLNERYYFTDATPDKNYELLIRYFVTVGILVELLIESSVLMGYIVSVTKFNRLKPVPDVEQYEYLLPCDARSSSEIGYRLEGEAVADLLEKQADLLCYFKSTIIDLKSKLSELSASHH